MALSQKITSNLWFDSEAEDAARLFYVSVFKNASIGRITRYGEEGFEFNGAQPGTVMTIEFVLEGQKLAKLVLRADKQGHYLSKFTTPE
jgi:predicted 3-demethylubiquinone-9 3-methyltransferase (glyoxalase superfamily)